MCETAMAVAQLETDDHQPENGFVSPETTSPALLSRIDGCVLPFLGGFGKYQKQLIVLTWIPALFIGFSQFSDSFLLAQPNNTCVLPMTNSSNMTLSPSSLFNGQNNSGVKAPYLSNGTRHNNTDDAQCRCTQWRYEMQMGLRENVVTKWNLVCDSKRKVHIAKFSLLVGSIFGYLVMGVLADWFGRHPVLIISVLFMLVFGLTVAFSVNVPMFSTLRFFEGFCLAGISLSLYVLRIELCLPGWRFSMTMVANFVMLGGQLLMPGVAVLCRDWQVLQAVIICPLFLMLSYIWLFPESLRWLLATQQFCRSKWLIARIAKKNKANLERDADELLTELHQASQKKPKRTCIVKMVGTRNLWKNIVVLCVNSLTGYGIHHCFARSMMYQEAQETTMFHNFYADYYVMAGIAVASCIALCPAVGLMGRRGGLLMFMIITALASLLQLGLLNLLGKYSVQLNIGESDTLKTNFSVAFSIIGMFSSHAVSNLSIFFCAEITPTVIRGGGLGLVLASAGFGMLTAPIMELHDQKGYFLHHVIFACCTLICIICILLLPETRYQPLPETLADGESYTRQPLLPPRKPGEQHFLLTKSESREYARVHDTPLHEAAATAVSTMDSTASSAIDITLPSVFIEEDVATQAAADTAAHLNAKPAALGDDKPSSAVPVGDGLTADHSTENHDRDDLPALDATETTDIQLTAVEPELPQDSSTPLLANSTRAPRDSSPRASSPRADSPRASSPRADSPRAGSPRVDSQRAGSPRSDSPRADSPRADSPRASSLRADSPRADSQRAGSPRASSPRADSPRADSPRAGSPRSDSPTHSPVVLDLIPPLLTAPPDTDAVASAKIKPPAAVPVTDSVPIAKSNSPVISNPSPPHQVACAPLIDASSLAVESSPAPALSRPNSSPDMETNMFPAKDTTAPAAGDIKSHGLTDPNLSPAHLINDLLVSPTPPVTDSNVSPVVDATPLTLVDSPIPLSIDSLPDTIPPIPPSPPPLSKDSPSLVISTSSMDSTTAPGSTTPCHRGAAAPPPPLPLPLVDSATPLVTDTSQNLAADSAMASPPPSPGTPPSFSMDCTVSSPIDSGLTAADAATVNGVASS